MDSASASDSHQADSSPKESDRAKPAASPLGQQQNDVSISLKDDDLALARIIQEQERAFYLLQYGGHEGDHDFNDIVHTGSDGLSGRHSRPAESSQQNTLEPLDDEEVARRMQEEEDRTSYQQMFGQPGVDYLRLGLEAEGYDDGAEALGYEDWQALGEVAGTVSKGLAASLVQQLPTCQYSRLQPSGSDCPDKCCICQLDFEAEDEVKLLPCKHFFHTSCVDHWLTMQKVCVLCNKEVSAATGLDD